MLRIVLITLVVLNVSGLAFWWAEPEVTSVAPETSASSVSPAAAQPGPTTEARVTVASSVPARVALPELPTKPAPAEGAVTALPPIAPATPLAGEPAPAEAAVPALPTIAPAIPLAAEPAPAEAAPAALPVAAVPSALPATSSPERRAEVQPPKTQAATAVTIVNGSELSAKTITVLSYAKAVSQAGPLAPKAKATLRLPKMSGCLVTVAATFEGGSVSDGRTIDLCKVKLVRLTD